MTEQNYEQAFFEYANKAATKIREIYHIFGGYECSSPEEGTMLGDVYDCIAEMISLYLVLVTGKEMNSDELNDMTTDIMSTDNGRMENYG